MGGGGVGESAAILEAPQEAQGHMPGARQDVYLDQWGAEGRVALLETGCPQMPRDAH